MSSNIPDPISPLDSAIPDPADVEKNKIFAILAYFGIFFLVPLLAAKDSAFARYHTNQGVVLFLVGIGVSAAVFVVGWIPFIGWLLACFMGPLTVVVWVVMAVVGMINAAQGKMKPLPVIGGTVILK
jgi:uncharacterized membrane protein